MIYCLYTDETRKYAPVLFVKRSRYEYILRGECWYTAYTLKTVNEQVYDNVIISTYV